MAVLLTIPRPHRQQQPGLGSYMRRTCGLLHHNRGRCHGRRRTRIQAQADWKCHSESAGTRKKYARAHGIIRFELEWRPKSEATKPSIAVELIAG
jgi:hypothetical protein